jgi:hypothetical protein
VRFRKDPKNMLAEYRAADITGGILIAMGLLVTLILWSMLLPGYILTLDMVWVPDPQFRWVEDGFNNSLPVRLFVLGSSAFFPGWVSQKALLIALFFLLLVIPYRYLPITNARNIRVFAALLYALNPFVYSRLLAGQWYVLLGYALLPLVLYALLKFLNAPGTRRGAYLGATLALVGVFSVHVLLLAILLAILGALFYADRLWRCRSQAYLGIAASVGIFLIICSYWIVPAMLRAQPLEERFDEAHWQAFAAAPQENVPTLLNLAILGGFWAEDNGWSGYFVWPQQSMWFWACASVILVLAIIGAARGFRNPITRRETAFLATAGILAFVLAAGASDTVFKSLNTLLYRELPYWAGMRDSHKIIAILALVYAKFAADGLEVSVALFRSLIRVRITTSAATTYVESAILLALLVPAGFGLYMWGGFQKQLEPVWYPAGWSEAREILRAEGGKAIVLPWEGYFSQAYANNLVTANPAPHFFGYEHVLASRTVGLEQVYDQERDPAYRQMDTVVRSDDPDAPETREALRESQITHVLFLSGLLPFSNSSFPFLANLKLTTLYRNDSIALYRIETPISESQL